jgi:hypothetical protein
VRDSTKVNRTAVIWLSITLLLPGSRRKGSFNVFIELEDGDRVTTNKVSGGFHRPGNTQGYRI